MGARALPATAGVRTCSARFLEIQLAGASSNPEVGVELRRMTKVTAAIKGETRERSQQRIDSRRRRDAQAG
jgi:hypothetical protein